MAKERISLSKSFRRIFRIDGILEISALNKFSPSCEWRDSPFQILSIFAYNTAAFIKNFFPYTEMVV